MLAAASIITAANGLLGIAPSTCQLQLIDRLHRITAIETVRVNPSTSNCPHTGGLGEGGKIASRGL